MGISESNLALLKKDHPELAKRLGGISYDGVVDLFAGKSGGWVARAADLAGDPVLLASEYDPQKEARRFVEAQKLEEHEAYVVMGFGMGYHLLEILKHLGKEHYFLVVEQNAAVMRAAMEHVDFSPLFESGKFSFFCGGGLVDLSAWYSSFIDRTFVEDITVVRHAPSLRLNPTFYTKAATELEASANRRIVDLATSVAWSRKFQRNILANALNVARAGAVGPLLDALKGVPAIIVAAGPSLDKNVDLLKQAKGKALIVTVGTALKQVLGSGVTPDAVVAMDPTDKSYAYFQNVGDIRDVALVADPEVCPRILDDFPGGRLVIDVPTPVTQWLRRWVGEKGTLPKGRTVAHTAFYFARHLGCDPICFIGLDLALTGDKMHASGCNEVWGEEVQFKPGDPGIVFVDSVDGGKVATMRHFLSFLTIFETEVARTDADCIDATEGGALKRGMGRMPLSQVIADYCRTDRDIRGPLRSAWEGDPRAASLDTAGLRSEVLRVRSAVLRVENFSRQGEQLIGKITGYLETKGYHEVTLKPLLVRINDLHRQANEETTAMNLLHRHLVDTRIFFQSRSVRKIEDMEMGQDRLSRELARSSRLLTDLIKAAAFLEEELGALEKRLEHELPGEEPGSA